VGSSHLSSSEAIGAEDKSMAAPAADLRERLSGADRRRSAPRRGDWERRPGTGSAEPRAVT
jgi:hypothetical protein